MNLLQKKKYKIIYNRLNPMLQIFYVFLEYFSKNVVYLMNKYCLYIKNILDQIIKLIMMENSVVIYAIILHLMIYYYLWQFMDVDLYLNLMLKKCRYLVKLLWDYNLYLWIEIVLIQEKILYFFLI